MSGLIALGDPEFSAYMQKVMAIPVLKEQEEKDLIDKWCNKRDVTAAQKLIEAYLRLVAKVAVKFKSYGLPLMDIVSEGNIGLMKAIKNFKIEAGCKIATYAVWWIKAAITDHIIKYWSVVKIGTTVSQRKLFFNLRKLKNSIINSDNKISSNQVTKKIADTLDVKERDVKNMDVVLSCSDASLNAPICQDSSTELHDTIADSAVDQECSLIANQELAIKKKLLKDAINSLSPRYKEIFGLRVKSPPSTLKEISQMFGISQERVRQIHAAATEKIKCYIKKNSKGLGMITQ